MKNYIIIVYSFALLFCSCENSVEMYDEYKQEYVVNCVLDLNSNTQFLTISKSYLDQNTTLADHQVKGAKITISSNSSNLNFVECDTIPPLVNQQNGKFTYYKLANFKPNKGENFKLSVELPDGKILTAATKTPFYSFFVFEDSETIQVGENYARIRWSFNEPGYTPIVNLPRLKLVYYKVEGKDTLRHEVKIPEKTSNKAEELFFLAGDSRIAFIDSQILKAKMEEISGADTSKFNYLISHIEANIMIMDKNLGTYYMAVQNPQNGISVLLNQVEFTNMSQGFGIFGSYLNEKKDFFLTEDYIKKFKYNKFYRKE